MKKVMTLFVILGTIFSMLTCASAEYTYFAWPDAYSMVGIPDVELKGAIGDGETPQVFFVTSYGNASITLKQTKGTCQELSYVKLISGFLGTAKEWGKYEIVVNHAETGVNQVYRWDKTYDNETITLYMNQPGNYYVYIRPYTNTEMTDSYLLDKFAGWENPPQWWVGERNNCTYSSSSPFEY